MVDETAPIGIGVIGFGWMGRVHTTAYTRVGHHYPLARRPRLVAVADEVPGRADQAAAAYGFERATNDWRSLLDAPDISAVSITAPNFAHREIGEAFAAAGKHIWIEKPVGVTADDAAAVRDAVRAAGVQSAVGFNYRNAPAVEELRRRIADGEIGEITHASFRMLGDYAADASGAFTWRYELARAGHGVLGDLASHAVDLVRHLLGEIDEVVADGAIFVPRRRRPSGVVTGHERVSDGELVDVENEDWVSAILRLSSGARVTLEASRVAVGHQNDYGVRIHGTRGVLEWDFRRMGELVEAAGDAVQDLPLATRFVGTQSGDLARFQPGGALALSYDDLKVVEAERFLRSIVTGQPVGAVIDDAVAAAVVIDALAESTRTRRWTSVGTAIEAAR
ncbi:Gfo/Idh/MocA family protein [Promicromonospora sp. Populi]|uniref:Gfo/Idh/MocA family protein n=1 Tax=Promicromonospora sp. Populi TaxID=3239420 RepID=UPI0034E20F6E